jgi:carbon-monoxide dehydrogenase small subunit
MAQKHFITATVNGDEVEFTCDSEDSLLDVLRNELHLTGTKNGCGSGDCGACTVIMNGRAINACLVLGAECEDANIETIEGMANGNELHPLQQKFLDLAALQCGVCTPGMLNMAKALLEKNPDPTETEVRFGLAGNLCRCTGYDKIVRAVLETAAEMRASKS